MDIEAIIREAEAIRSELLKNPDLTQQFAGEHRTADTLPGYIR